MYIQRMLTRKNSNYGSSRSEGRTGDSDCIFYDAERSEEASLLGTRHQWEDLIENFLVMYWPM